MVTVSSPALIRWLLIAYSVFFAASELSLVSPGPTTLQLYPSLLVENSPGSKPVTKVKCERIHIYGLPRLKHLKKFASSMNVNISFVNPRGRIPNVDVCFHRNASLAVGMCPQGQWERLTKGVLVKSISPFDDKMLDIRMAVSYAEGLQVSLYEGVFVYRIWFLILGILLLTLASWISKSVVFYYSGAMAIGIFLVMLIVLFQGMKLLPTGRKSSLAIFLYSCIVGFGSFLLGYAPGLLRSLLTEIGVSEEMYNPIATSLLVSLAIAGAWLGFWVVKKLVLTKEGSVDTNVAHLVTWTIRVVASAMILQSSIDPLLAIEALVGGIFVSEILKRTLHPLFHCAYKKIYNLKRIRRKESRSPYRSPTNNSNRSFTKPTQGSTSTSSMVSESDTFYSTFHDTPDRKKFSKDEWETFTKESTRNALEGLVSSPDFSKWAVAHADRITLAPNDASVKKQSSCFGLA